MTTLRNWLNHLASHHCRSLDAAYLGLFAGRFASWPTRRIECCRFCQGFVLKLER